MFNFNKKNQVSIDLSEYEKLECAKVDQKIEAYRFDKQRKIDLDEVYAAQPLSAEFFALQKRVGELEIKKTSIEKEIEILDVNKESIAKNVSSSIERKNQEISLLKENHVSALKNKQDLIDLLTSQIEVLMAKLVEIKITDAHIHVETSGQKK